MQGSFSGELISIEKFLCFDTRLSDSESSKTACTANYHFYMFRTEGKLKKIRWNKDSKMNFSLSRLARYFVS